MKTEKNNKDTGKGKSLISEHIQTMKIKKKAWKYFGIFLHISYV